MSARREAKDAKYKLKAGVKRAVKLHERAIAQLCDGDLPVVDRESAEVRARQASTVIEDLTRSLNRVQVWLWNVEGPKDRKSST